ncbi:unnamed protein product, partial [Heterotrigona itama]
MGAKGPKFSSDDRVNSFVRAAGSSSTLLCPAQGFPVPSFRARGIQGASLSERREKRHLCQSREILGRDHLLCSGIATSHSQ